MASNRDMSLPACPPTYRPHVRRPGIFRRRMILQLTSLLDLLLIIVFVQYLEMQEISARAIAHETTRARLAEAAQNQAQQQRDLLLEQDRKDLHEVWYVHVNGNGSIYPDQTTLVTFEGQKKILLPADNAAAFCRQFVSTVGHGSKPASPCLLVLTVGNVLQATHERALEGLELAAADSGLQSAWGAEKVRFVVVDGDYAPDQP